VSGSTQVPESPVQRASRPVGLTTVATGCGATMNPLWGSPLGPVNDDRQSVTTERVTRNVVVMRRRRCQGRRRVDLPLQVKIVHEARVGLEVLVTDEVGQDTEPRRRAQLGNLSRVLEEPGEHRPEGTKV
jgi:hypothetical protein